MRTLLLAMSSLYTSLVFTREHLVDNHTYLEWTGHALITDLAGVTVVEWDASHRIVSVWLHQRPFGAVARFAAELAKHNRPGFSEADFALPINSVDL